MVLDSSAVLAILQDDAVGFRGQIVALVLAETSEAAREGAALVHVRYRAEPHEAEVLDDDGIDAAFRDQLDEVGDGGEFVGEDERVAGHEPAAVAGVQEPHDDR